MIDQAKLEERRAALRQQYEDSLRKLEAETAEVDAITDAGLPEPDFVCRHKSHTSLKYYATRDGRKQTYHKWPLAEAVELLERFEPYILPMQPASDGAFLSTYPDAARRDSKCRYPIGEPGYEVCVRFHSFGRSDSSDGYHDHTLEWWFMLNDRPFHVILDTQIHGVPIPYATWDSHRRWTKVHPNWEFCGRVVRYSGSAPSDINCYYMMPTIYDLKRQFSLAGPSDDGLPSV